MLQRLHCAAQCARYCHSTQAACLIELEQERAAGILLRDTEAAPETLDGVDALRLLGLRMDVVRRALGLGDAGCAGEAASGERIMLTLAVQGLRERQTPSSRQTLRGARALTLRRGSWGSGL